MTALAPNMNIFASPDALAAALAETVTARLAAAIIARGAAMLAVSGGRTPVRFFEALARQAIDWRNVTVALVDERFVPSSSERSNQHLVETCLLKGAAAKAHFVGLYHPAETVEAAADLAAAEIARLHLPFDAVILGMGADGHTASFFPDAEGRAALMSADEKRSVLPVHAKSAGESRLTLSLPVLAAARFAALHIEGEEKLSAFEKAMCDGEDPPAPIRTVIERSSQPVQVYWAP